MDITKCKVFLKSVELGSFSKAASVLGYTTSGVSQLVNAFEKDMGFPLLTRSNKGVKPTDNALKIIPVLREILLQEEKLYQINSEIKGLTVGNITIGAYSSIATHWLPSVIKGFQEIYPQIEIRLMEGIRQEVESWLCDRKTDIAFFTYMEPMPYDWIPIAEDPMLAILPKNHPLAKETVYPLQNCQHERFIMPALGRDDDVAELLSKNNLTPNISFSTLENFAALAMIEQGMGMSIMNELITKRWQCDVVKLPLDPPQKITFGIAVPSLKTSPPAVKKFVKYSTNVLIREKNKYK
ncbi:LysR family transcriptional regulator [Tissierella sp. MSJ-40]|uniref:LysR family transcriptional regulator n=1 Tax=Tissierella simiarum TaxID=2841534 RepID=A0ABS6EB13_9FIRM|nr:LysR family transcriptional regulator [Tissierella simiarum]MBU5440107.1 LysR family transcriptional regulator [Tissierella simiarum]